MAGAGAAAVATTPRLFNRQLSWLAFNSRVLALAEDSSLPLGDRLRFCSIWANNLDEYFQVRIAELKEDAITERARYIDDGYTSSSQLAAIEVEIAEQTTQAMRIAAEVWSAVGQAGVELVDWHELTPEEVKQVTETFVDEIFPILTPLVVDPGHPFPYISSMSLNLGLLLVEPGTGVRRFGRLKVPIDHLPRHVRVTGSDRLVPLEQVVRANIAYPFPGVEVAECALFRVTRNADISVTADMLDHYDDDLLSAVESELANRRFGAITRLEIDTTASSELRQVLTDQLGTANDEFVDVQGPLDLHTWCAADQALPKRADLFLTSIPSAIPPPLANVRSSDEFFALLRQRDVLMHHPYDSFEASVLAFVQAASVDPDVQAIKLTLYRTSGDSSVVEALIQAAENGKSVVVVVELKARFDEAANIRWARRLERAGVHVAYGFIAMKVHTKTCLVVRREADGLRRYCHFGTGNYNARTARLYTDVGVFTSAPDFGQDLSALFNSLTGFHVPGDYQQLVVAPGDMRSQLTELIENEGLHGSDGLIRMKMNSLVDPEVIEALYAASQQGVQIEIIVRGQCCLRPGVPGLSETITARSIVGRYLEHARLYWFANGEGPGVPQYLIGSADLMTRNLDRRVEVLVPIHDPKCASQLDRIVSANLADDRRAWELQPDGAWNPPNPHGVNEMHLMLHAEGARNE